MVKLIDMRKEQGICVSCGINPAPTHKEELKILVATCSQKES